MSEFVFEMDKDVRGEWRWRLKSTANGKIIADSAEGYTDKRGCEHGIALVKAHAPTARIVDKTAAMGTILGAALSGR